YLPTHLDYCALAPTLIAARNTGLAGYAPFIDGATTTLGVQTPVYRGGAVPSTVIGRQRAFLGWLGELLQPTVVLDRALQGHPNLAVMFRYDSPFSHVVFHSGRIRTAGQSTKIDLQVGREASLRNAH